MPADRVRTTISLDPEVHEIFKRMAEAAGMSVSRCMGEWLADTADGAQFVALKMQEARKAPMMVMREFQSMSLGMTDAVNQTMSELRKSDRQAPAAEPRAARQVTMMKYRVTNLRRVILLLVASNLELCL